MNKVMIVVADSENGFAHLLHQRQQHLIKLAAEVRVLIRRPLVEQNDVTLFRQRQQQRHAFFLPFGEFEVKDLAVLKFQLVRHLQVRQPFFHQRRIGLLPFRTQQLLKQPDVGEHRREKLAVVLGLLRAQRSAIQ